MASAKRLSRFTALLVDFDAAAVDDEGGGGVEALGFGGGDLVAGPCGLDVGGARVWRLCLISAMRVDEAGRSWPVDGAHVLDAHRFEHAAVPLPDLTEAQMASAGVLYGVGDAGGGLWTSFSLKRLNSS